MNQASQTIIRRPFVRPLWLEVEIILLCRYVASSWFNLKSSLTTGLSHTGTSTGISVRISYVREEPEMRLDLLTNPYYHNPAIDIKKSKLRRPPRWMHPATPLRPTTGSPLGSVASLTRFSTASSIHLVKKLSMSQLVDHLDCSPENRDLFSWRSQSRRRDGPTATEGSLWIR
jgi:hypothetical protein